MACNLTMIINKPPVLKLFQARHLPWPLTMEGGTNLCLPDHEPEVQLPYVPIIVAKGVGVLLDEQVLQHPALGHEAEEVVVTTKEHMQPQLRMTCKQAAVSA